MSEIKILEEAKEWLSKKGYGSGTNYTTSVVAELMKDFSNQSKKEERFKMPTDEQMIDIAVIFNEGKLEQGKLTDMVAMANFIVDRLYENGDISQKSSKED